MPNPCIELHAPHLKGRFDELVKSGMSEREAGRKAAMEDFAKLDKELIAFKESIGIKLSKEQKAGYKEPDNSAKVKEITDAYADKIKAASQPTPEVKVKESPSKKEESIQKEEVVTPLKDVESTEKALEGEDITDELEDLFLKESGDYKRWFSKIGDSLFLKSKGLPDKFTESLLREKGIDPKKLNTERNEFLKANEKRILAEAYHKAKSDGSNPELVKAVESALKDQPNQPTNEKEKRKEEGLLSPKEKKEEVKPIGGNIELSKEEKSAGFIKLPIAKVKKALKDFQGRIADYSKTTYDSIVNEAKDGTLNISSIPAIQVWGQTGELLAGHSRVKAFEDLASGKLPLNEKFKTSDFENINTQIVDAETRDEAKKIAERSNSGAQQTPFENSKILARMRKDGANKTAIDKEAQRLAQFGDKKHTINLSNLDPNGKAATTLEAAEKSPEKLGKEKVESIRLAADKAGEMRGEFSELTKLHEDEIFDALVNGKIKASEVEARINRVVNSAAEQFDPNNKLNIESIANISPQEMVFQQKTADLRKEIKDLQRSIKKDAETKLTPIEQDYLERAIVLNNGDTKKGRSEFESEATKKLITKKTEDAKALIKRRQEDLQTHLLSKKNLSGAPSLFDVVNQEIKNKTITNEQANKFIEATEDVTKDESAIKNLESKAESTDEVTLKEVIKEADALIENATKEEVISSQSKTTTDGKEKSTDSTSEKAEKVDKGGDTKAPTTEKKFTEKSKKIAEKIRSFKSKPLELKDEKGNPIIIAKKGIDQNDIIEGIAKLVEAGGQLADAIATELSKHKWYNDLTDKGKEGVRKQFEDHLSKDVTGITHEKTEETRTEFGLGDFYEKTTKEDEALFAEADKQIKEGYNIESLISKLEQGHIPSDLETTILKKYKATVEAKIAKDPSDENLADLRRLVKATDVAGTLAGRGLRSRQGLEIRDDSLAGYFTRETDVNQDAPLTETQKERVIKEHTEITEAQKAFNEKIAELEAENAKLKADAELKKLKANTKKTKKTHDDFVAERKSLIDQFKEEGKFDKNKPQAQGISLTNKQVVIIGKLAKSYVDEGISKLGDVVTKIASELGLSERDVQDVLAGEYNEKKKTKTELAQTLLDIKEQAKLINKLDALLRGETPKVEKAKIQRNQEIEGLRKRIKDLQKERADAERKIKNDESKTQREANKKTPEQQALDNLKKRYEREINTITEDLRTGNFDKSLPKPPLKLDKEAIDLKDRLIKLKREREIRLIKQEYANRTAQQRAVDKVVEVLNVPRTLMSSMDFSAPLRQAVVVTVSHPQIAAGAGLEMFKQSVSQKRFDRWFSDVRQMPRWKLMEDSGLYVADPHDPRLTAKEEAFMNNLVEKIPFIGGAVKIPNSVPVIGGKKIGGLVKGTERAYVGYLNKMRVDLFNRFADAFEAKGHTFENSPELFKGLASYVNNSTGRGKLGVLESSAPMLNTAFFAPRLIASRINMLNPLYYKQLPKPVRVQALKDMAVFIGVGITVLTIAKLLGADVEDDPRSSDFGKIKDGNTRWDIWGGFQAYVRIIAQVLTGQSKSARTGSIQELSGEGAFGRDRGDVVGSFLRGKLAPIPAMTWNLIKGETMTGEKATPFSELREHMMPMIAGDLKDAMKDRGVRSLYEVGLPSMFGIGASTYLPRGYDKVNKKDPVYEFLYKKNMNLSEPQQGELTDDEYKKMIELREPIFRDKWEVIIENGALIDKEGKVTIDKDEDVSKKKVDELNMEELSSLMKSVGNSATREAKKKVILKEVEQKKSRRIKL